jgi:hypothetical protein
VKLGDWLLGGQDHLLFYPHLQMRDKSMTPLASRLNAAAKYRQAGWHR